ncbi:MAG: hypothetical protein ACK55I_04185, partial [bacterium]
PQPARASRPHTPRKTQFNPKAAGAAVAPRTAASGERVIAMKSKETTAVEGIPAIRPANIGLPREANVEHAAIQAAPATKPVTTCHQINADTGCSLAQRSKPSQLNRPEWSV